MHTTQLGMQNAIILTAMKSSIKQELTEYIEERMKERDLYKVDFDDLHFDMFNSDYYIIGYYQAEKWLERHGLSVFNAISICNEYEDLHFGERQTKYDNAETLVNSLVYWYGFDLLHDVCEELKYPSKTVLK